MTEVFLNKLKTMIWILLYFTILDVNNQFWAHFLLSFCLFVCFLFPSWWGLYCSNTLVGNTDFQFVKTFVSDIHICFMWGLMWTWESYIFLKYQKHVIWEACPKVPLVTLCNSITLVHIWTALVAKWEKNHAWGWSHR